MGFLDTLKEVITNKPSNLREPKFLKEFNEENKQLLDLQELLNDAPEESISDIEQHIKLLTYGLTGEKNVAYELKNSHMPILILHDLFLEYNGLSAQIDFVVIDQRFILIVECKNMVGDIEITRDGDFIRYFKSANGKVYKKEGMYSPIVQNERHAELIRDILKAEKYFSKSDYGMIKHVVTVANPKAVINSKYAKKALKDHIIKHDQLINKMKQLHEANANGRWFTEESMYDIANCILRYSGEYVIDYAKKYKPIKSVRSATKNSSPIEEVRSATADNSNMKKHEVKPHLILKDHEVQSEVALKESQDENMNLNEEENSIEKTLQVENKEIIEEVNSIEESLLYKELKEYRYNKSREEKVKPYFLYNNLQLEAIIKAKPQSLDELKNVNGFGNVKCEKYGEDIIEIVKRNL